MQLQSSLPGIKCQAGCNGLLLVPPFSLHLTVLSMPRTFIFLCFCFSCSLGRESPPSPSPLHLSLKNLSGCSVALVLSAPARCWCEPFIVAQITPTHNYLLFTHISESFEDLRLHHCCQRVPKGYLAKIPGTHTEEGNRRTGNHMYLMHYFMLKKGGWKLYRQSI